MPLMTMPNWRTSQWPSPLALSSGAAASAAARCMLVDISLVTVLLLLDRRGG